MFGCDTEQNQWFTWDDLGNCLIGSDLLLLRDGQHYIKLSENDSITYSKDGYYIFSIYNKSGYQHKENEYGLFNYNGKILMKAQKLSCRWQSMNLKIVCLDGEAMVRYSDVMEIFIM